MTTLVVAPARLEQRARRRQSSATTHTHERQQHCKQHTTKAHSTTATDHVINNCALVSKISLVNTTTQQRQQSLITNNHCDHQFKTLQATVVNNDLMCNVGIKNKGLAQQQEGRLCDQVRGRSGGGGSSIEKLVVVEEVTGACAPLNCKPSSNNGLVSPRQQRQQQRWLWRQQARNACSVSSASSSVLTSGRCNKKIATNSTSQIVQPKTTTQVPSQYNRLHYSHHLCKTSTNLAKSLSASATVAAAARKNQQSTTQQQALADAQRHVVVSLINSKQQQRATSGLNNNNNNNNKQLHATRVINQLNEQKRILKKPQVSSAGQAPASVTNSRVRQGALYARKQLHLKPATIVLQQTSVASTKSTNKNIANNTSRVPRTTPRLLSSRAATVASTNLNHRLVAAPPPPPQSAQSRLICFSRTRIANATLRRPNYSKGQQLISLSSSSSLASSSSSGAVVKRPKQEKGGGSASVEETVDCTLYVDRLARRWSSLESAGNELVTSASSCSSSVVSSTCSSTDLFGAGVGGSKFNETNNLIINNQQHQVDNQLIEVDSRNSQTNKTRSRSNSTDTTDNTRAKNRNKTGTKQQQQHQQIVAFQDNCSKSIVIGYQEDVNNCILRLQNHPSIDNNQEISCDLISRHEKGLLASNYANPCTGSHQHQQTPNYIDCTTSKQCDIKQYTAAIATHQSQSFIDDNNDDDNEQQSCVNICASNSSTRLDSNCLSITSDVKHMQQSGMEISLNNNECNNIDPSELTPSNATSRTFNSDKENMEEMMISPPNYQNVCTESISQAKREGECLNHTIGTTATTTMKTSNIMLHDNSDLNSAGSATIKSQPLGLHQSININNPYENSSATSNDDTNNISSINECLADLVDNVKSPSNTLCMSDQTAKLSKVLMTSDTPIARKEIEIIIKTEPICDYYNLEARPFARGKFAQVKRCIKKDTTTGECFAAKCIKKRRRLVDVRHEILLEIDALKLSYRTEHIIKLYEVFETPNEMILVLEMANGGELQSVLDEEDSINEPVAKRMIGQILNGLICLHDNQIAHLDLKPQNLLLTKPLPDGDVKLCDFGMSRRITNDCEVREICGTPDYVAPEILRYDPISLATDMWSLGVVTYVLMSGYSPFGSENKQQTFCNITQAKLEFPSDIFDRVSEEAMDFIRKLIVREPADRLTSREARQHHWLKSDAD